MLKYIPSLFSIRFILFEFLILRLDVGFGTFGSIFHTFCDLACLLSTSSRSCIRLSSSCLLLGTCRILTFFSASSRSILLRWSCSWLCWLLTRCMNVLALSWVRLLLLLLHFGFVFLINI